MQVLKKRIIIFVFFKGYFYVLYFSNILRQNAYIVWTHEIAALFQYEPQVNIFLMSNGTPIFWFFICFLFEFT